MSQAELAALERDVEQTRSKFATDLARLRSPETLASFKDELWAETSGAAKDNVQKVVDAVKRRVSENPLAVLAIGAGLSWRLFHKPPIASVLVGVGLFSLLRSHGDGSHGNGSVGDVAGRARELADSAREKAQEKMHKWADQAGDRVAQSVAQLSDGAVSVAKQASEAVHDATTAARRTATQLGERVVETAHHAGDLISDAASDQKVRDNVLLGAAALALTAALGIAYQRRAEARGGF